MKTIKINLYKFSELSEDAKQKALESLCDINVDYDWWDGIYEDAKNIGCEIKAFDIDRGSYCNLEFTDSAIEVARAIMEGHGAQCETHKTAEEFLRQWDNAVSEHSNGIDTERVDEDKESEFDEVADVLEEEFKTSLSEDYRIMLRNEYEYMTSEEAIIESIEANKYDFTEDGELY